MNEEKDKTPHKPKSVIKKIGRIVLRSILIILLLIVVILVLIQTPPVQNFIVKKATAYLSKKLNTRVELGKVYIGFPKDVVLEDIYVQDQAKDTLLAAGSVKVNISMLKLLHSEIEINEVKLDRITTKIRRVLPDTSFNFQFIVNAFSSEQKKPKQPDTASLRMNVKYVQLDNIRVVYKDVVTGNDVDLHLGHFDTRIDSFDLDHQHFSVPVTRIRGLKGRVYQSQPLVQTVAAVQQPAATQQPSSMQLNFKTVSFGDIDLDYQNTVSAMYSRVTLGNLVLNANNLDLQKQVIDLKNIELSNTVAAIRFGKMAAQKVPVKDTAAKAGSGSENSWRVIVGSIALNDNNIRFDDDNKPHEKYGMDYSHINARDLTVHLDNLLYSKDSISGTITTARMKEQSGFQLNEWKTSFLYANNEAYLKDLLLQTPGTEISRSLVLHYPSIAALKTNIGALNMDVDIHNSKLQVKDILTFVPSLRTQAAFAQPNSTLHMNGVIRGSVARLDLKAFQLQGFQDTRVNVSGTIVGLPDVKKVGMNLVINELSTSRRDMALFVPKGSVPSSVTIPERIKLTGRVSGGMNNISPDLLLSTSLGAISVKGNIQNPSDAKTSKYDAVIETRNLDLGTLLKNPQNLGRLSARFVARGRGYDPKTANASFNGVINSAIIKKYNYRNLRLDASIANQNLTAKANIQDPNIDITFDASGNFSGKYPSIKLNANIDSIKTLALHLTTDSIIYRGVITADFPVTDPDHLNGNLFVTNSLLVKDSQRLQIDTLQLAAGTNDRGQFISLNADALSFELQGQYRLTQLGDVFMQAIQPYYTISTAKPVKVDPYNFTFTGSLVNKPIVKTFLPDLQSFDPITFGGSFASTNGWNLNINAPVIQYGDNHIDSLRLQGGTQADALALRASIRQLTSGKSVALYNTRWDATIVNNLVDFTLNVKDKAARDKYRVSALFRQPSPGDYIFSLKPQQLLLNYDPWTVPGDNQISILKSDINARNFVLTKNNQVLSINSLSEQVNAPMEVRFDNFKLATLANFVQSDSLLVDGTLNGRVVLNNLTKQPTFTSDLTMADVSVKKDTIGNVNIKVNNTVENTFAADMSITGHGNDIQLAGNYYVRPDSNSSFDLTLDIRQVLLNSLQGATMGAITNASGSIGGKFAINGNLKSPSVNGNLDFKKAAFNLSMLNSYFRIDDESIKVTNEGVHFDTFTVSDSSGNKAVLDGMVYAKGLGLDHFDLTLKANNFRALNTTKKAGALYYGQLYFNTNLSIKGTQTKPVVDGSLSINDSTKLTVVLPQRQPGVESRDGIVEFVDFDAVPNDSLFTAKYDSINKSGVMGLDVAININVRKNAEFNLIVDEANGDFLNVRGQATLSAGIDPSGKITMAGSYELEEGSYQLSFNFLQRKFNIQKGSNIVWTGEPTKANINITAVYVAKTAPLDLVADQLDATSGQRNYYRQILPFEVDLIMKGELMKPELTFNIQLPPENNYNVDKSIINTVDTKLEMIRQEPSELNKQVFALLLLGRFVSENPFQSSGGGMTAESFARESVSKLLTEQLNKLASDLVQGVDINFDVASTTNDYTTGEQKSRTDLNVALSKRLLNDRLTVTIGSSFALEGAESAQPGAKQQTNNLAGNVNIDYKLSKDGRYALRAYRKNEYEGVLEGYIIETGVGFVISIDYNTFKQIFLSKKQRKDRNDLQKKGNKGEADDPKKDTKISKVNSNG